MKFHENLPKGKGRYAATKIIPIGKLFYCR